MPDKPGESKCFGRSLRLRRSRADPESIDGTIPDVSQAVASSVRLSEVEGTCRDVLALASEVPVMVWGRDQLGAGEMWNSNSVISWLLARAGLPAGEIRPPPGGRAPGLMTGVVAAEAQLLPDATVDPLT